MTENYKILGKVQIKIIYYISKIITNIPEYINVEMATPYADQLSMANKNTYLIHSYVVKMYHHNTVKLIFLCKHARPYIQTAIAFLITR